MLVRCLETNGKANKSFQSTLRIHMNAKTIERLAEEAKNPDELLRKLCEDINLTVGQKVYTVHGAGQSSVIGTFQGLTNGGLAKVKNPTGTYTVAAHLVFPKR